MTHPIKKTLLFVGLFSSFSVLASGALDYGLSEITRGMGGAGTALPQDSIIAAINPAGMVDVGSRMDVGAVIYVPSNGYNATSFTPASIPPGGIGFAPGYHSSDISLFFLPDLGINMPIDRKSAFGVSLYSIGGFGTEYKVNNTATVNIPGLGPTQLPGAAGSGILSSDLKQAITSLTYSRKFMHRASFGLSLLVGTQAFELRGLRNLGALSVAPNNVSNRGTDLSIGVGTRLGLLFDVLPKLSLGISYQPEMTMTKFAHYRGILPNGGEFDIPPFGDIGLAWHMLSTLVFAGDIEKVWYSAIPAYSASHNALLNGSCFANNSTCLGGSNGAGFGWKNDVIYKLGTQWQMSEKTALRAGFNRGSQVLSNQYGTENTLIPGAVVRNIFTVGATEKISKDDLLNGVILYIPEQSYRAANLFSGAANQMITTSLSGFGFGLSWSRVLP